MRKKYGYPELTIDAKRKILGLNSARLYGIKGIEQGDLGKRFKPVPKDYEKRMSKELKTILEFPGYTADNMAQLKDAYAAAGAQPSHARYGWVRVNE
jgi:hypothetical protein